MKQWEKVKNALDEPNRTYRARALFTLIEEEKKISVHNYKETRFATDVKILVNSILRDMANSESKEESEECVNRSVVRNDVKIAVEKWFEVEGKTKGGINGQISSTL